MAARIGHGTVISFAATSNATAFTSIATPKSITPQKMEATDVDVTNLSSANFTKEFLPGLVNGGEITLPISYDETATSTLLALIRSTKWWRIILPDTTFWLANGYVKGFGTEETTPEGEITNTMTIKVNGRPLYANDLVDSTYAADTSSVGVSLVRNATVADWSASNFEVFTGGNWVAATSVIADGTDLVFANVLWPASTVGLSWRIRVAPSYVVVPQSGTVPA